eukprot:6197560-Pleurochrysis_carterae.AAC.2
MRCGGHDEICGKRQIFNRALSRLPASAFQSRQVFAAIFICSYVPRSAQDSPAEIASASSTRRPLPR